MFVGLNCRTEAGGGAGTADNHLALFGLVTTWKGCVGGGWGMTGEGSGVGGGAISSVAMVPCFCEPTARDKSG